MRMSSKKRQSVFPVAPQNEILATLSADGGRRWLHPQISKGKYWKLRRNSAYILIGMFFLTPHIYIAGKPMIFLDLTHRQFTFFGTTLHPTDNLILAAFGASLILGILLVTAIFGRLWCGYACPQTVYLEFIFRPIEVMLEGPSHIRKRDEKRDITPGRFVRKFLKWLLFSVIAFLMSSTFIAYFTSFELLYSLAGWELFEHWHIVFAIMFFTALIFFDFTIFREQMCTIACPYGRLQSVLIDKDSMIVGYDVTRGEPRGRLQKNGEQQVLGDCIDCRRCITVCPTGIDIRRGLQMECIGCAQCIDACHDSMLKVNRPTGLIRYTSLKQLEGGQTKWLRPRVIIYSLIGFVIICVLLSFLLFRSPANVEILRAAQEAYRIMPNGDVANQMRIRLTNRKASAQSFTIKLVEPKEANLVVSMQPFVCGPNQVDAVNVVVTSPRNAFTKGSQKAMFEIESDKGFKETKEFILLGPYR